MQRPLTLPEGAEIKLHSWNSELPKGEEQESNLVSGISNRQPADALQKQFDSQTAIPTWALSAVPWQGYLQATGESTDQFDDSLRDCSKQSRALTPSTRSTVYDLLPSLSPTAYLAVRRLRAWHSALLLFLGPF